MAKMSSSVELHQKLNRIEASLRAENEARKRDRPTIDFKLDSPKAPRQRPGRFIFTGTGKVCLKIASPSLCSFDMTCFCFDTLCGAYRSAVRCEICFYTHS